MSYRSIKRVLGETSLERKCRFLFGGCLLLLITSAFWLFGSRTEKVVFQRNPIQGRLLVNQALFMLHWQRLETNEEFKLAINNMTENFRKEAFGCNFIKSDADGTPIKRKYLAIEVDTQGDELSSAMASDDGVMPTVTLNVADREVLERFMEPEAERSPEAHSSPFSQRLSADQNRYHYYQPIYADASVCVACHNARGDTPLGFPQSGLTMAGSGGIAGTSLNEGDLMAIAEVTIPNGETQRALNLNRAILLATAIVTVFLAMIAAYVIVRYVIVKPLRHLRDVSDAISHGNITLRADIQTGDEFESLAEAFNRMLRHLVTIQEELRRVNTDLDGKVDELAQVNMRLYEMNRIKSDFLATMSHELRTPLNSILGFSDVLDSIDSLDDKQKRYVQNIQTSGRTLLDMINDILDLAKMESGKMETRLTDFQVKQIVVAQCDMARPLTEKKNIDLKARVRDGLPPMHQDQSRVQQTLNNLLSNAIKFTPEGGRITVTADRDDEDCLVMRVIDTGVGIADQDQQAVFEKFRQGQKDVSSADAMTREYSGTGLGLSIVKELCKLLGGEVSLESELGKGSTFTVRLPWKLQEQPRLDSSLVEGFDEFSRSRYELSGHPQPQLPAPEPQAAE